MNPLLPYDLQRRTRFSVRRFKCRLRRVFVYARFRHQDSQRSSVQLGVSRSQMRHAIAGDVTKPGQHGSRDHVEHQLLRRAGF